MDGEVVNRTGSNLNRPSGGLRHIGSTAVGRRSEPSESWMTDGVCRDLDPDIFFPLKIADEKTAKAYCGQCLVRAQCLEYALANNMEHGVWGGKSERERHKIQKYRR